MNSHFYLNLALINIKKNNKTYIPYIITCSVTIMMFYILHALSINEDVLNYSHSLSSILSLGVIASGIFSVIFLFYTNSFIIKRRKKEIGLYNILGLEKKHISIILLFENIIIFFITITVGLMFGIILTKLMFLFLFKLLNLPIIWGFTVSFKSILLTTVVFLGILLLILISSIFHIKMSKPIELLKGGNHGEREPKSKWGLTAIGILTLGLGYYIALSVETPLSAINLFFVAVILVMVGTYAIFTSGSIVLLKTLRKNKKFYYKTRNFISISSMIYRMKQNAVGLANICILSTALLVMLSGTVALYIGMEDAISNRYPKDIVVIGDKLTEEDISKLNNLLNEQISNSNLNIINKVDYRINEYNCSNKGGVFVIEEKSTIDKFTCSLYTIPVSDYNRLEGKDIQLRDNEIIIFTTNKNFNQEQIVISNISYSIKEELNSIDLATSMSQNVINTYVLLVNDAIVFGEPQKSSYVIGFDSENSNEEVIAFTNDINNIFINNNIHVTINSAAANRTGFLELTGGLFFMGLFLGTLFLMATVLIIYYKQISEGFDDKDRFTIIQKVGIDKNEVKNIIRSQVLLMFFLPLIFTIIHIIFAFPIITKLLAILYLTNEHLYMFTTLISIIIFSFIYGIVFLLTARTYYKIVEY